MDAYDEPLRPQRRRRSPGSVLVDLTILISLLAGAQRLASEFGGDNDAGGADGHLRGRQPASSRGNATDPLFSVGDAVEVRAPDIHERYASPMAAPSDDDSFRGVAAASLGVREAYAHGTRAMCEYGTALASGGEDLAPCSVVAGPADDDGTYLVSSKRGDLVTYEEVPLSRIRRIASSRRLSEMEDEFAALAPTPYEDGIPDPEGDDGEEQQQPILEGLVEFYWDGSFFASPAMIARYDEPSKRYTLQQLMGGHRHVQMDKTFLHPYQIYAPGTRGNCNVGTLAEPAPVPCTVEGHAVEVPGGAISYTVSYAEGEGAVPRRRTLSFARVQRIRPKGKGDEL